MRFECQNGCVRCCEEKGFVYLSEADIPRIAKYLGMEQEEFERHYVFRTKNLRRFRKPRKAECSFLSASGCSIHPVKPTQCRTFPLWPEILEDEQELAETAKRCPGIGEGPDVTLEEIRLSTELMRAGYPHMYD